MDESEKNLDSIQKRKKNQRTRDSSDVLLLLL